MPIVEHGLDAFLYLLGDLLTDSISTRCLASKQGESGRTSSNFLADLAVELESSSSKDGVPTGSSEGSIGLV